MLVKWRIARDARMKREECGGRVWTDASRDFTVKVDVDRLDPNRTYYYQFEVQDGFGRGSARSPIGRTKTLPLFHARSLRFAVASCSNYPYGFFQVYRRIAERADLDFVLHLGDYIYEYANGQYGDGASIGRLVQPDHEILSLQDYRLRHATYKTDPDLQEAHRQHPFITVWDDHESANDSWHDGAENHNPELGEGDWERASARPSSAYFEWMPIREFAYRPKSPIYRAFRYRQPRRDRHARHAPVRSRLTRPRAPRTSRRSTIHRVSCSVKSRRAGCSTASIVHSTAHRSTTFAGGCSVSR